MASSGAANYMYPGGRGFPGVLRTVRAARDQARYAKVTAWREAAQETSSWSMAMFDETQAQVDNLNQVLLDTAAQVQQELFELGKIKEFTQVHAGRHRALQSTAKDLRKRAKPHKGFSNEVKDAQFAEQKGADGRSYCADCGAHPVFAHCTLAPVHCSHAHLWPAILQLTG